MNVRPAKQRTPDRAAPVNPARADVLDRIRTALGPGFDPGEPILRGYRRAGTAQRGTGEPDLIARFTDRLVDYRAHVLRTSAADVPVGLAARLAARGLAQVVVPDGFPAPWLTSVVARQRFGSQVSIADLEGIDGTVSLCATAVAETGTLVLDGGPGQGIRALSLVPDYLLVVVRGEQIVPGVPDAVAALDPRRPLTWISGPSATSDIELQRVEGVHGPRTLDVLIVDPG